MVIIAQPVAVTRIRFSLSLSSTMIKSAPDGFRVTCIMDGDEWSAVSVAILWENLRLPGYSSRCLTCSLSLC